MPVAPINGTELYHEGVGEGLPCLVMHGGLGVDHTQFRAALDPLGDVLRLVYYDHRGNGRSGRPPIEALTFAQLGLATLRRDWAISTFRRWCSPAVTTSSACRHRPRACSAGYRARS